MYMYENIYTCEGDRSVAASDSTAQLDGHALFIALHATSKGY